MVHPSSSNSGGSSASSSNLSPLAPPFTMDTCLPKQTPCPIGDFTEEASCAFALMPSHCNWLRLHPPNSLLDTSSDSNSQVDLINSTCAPSASKPYYIETQTINGIGNSTSASATLTTGTFPSNQHSNVIAKNLVKADPYYPKYSSALIENNSPSSVICESDCDILSMSSFAPFESPFQTDSIRCLSTLGYTYSWDDVHVGMDARDQGSLKNLDGRSGGQEKVVTSSLPCKSMLKQGNPDADGCEEVSGDDLGNVELLPRKCDVKPTGMNWLGSLYSPLIEKSSSTTCNMLKPSITNHAPLLAELPEMPYSQLQSPVSVMEPWCSLNPNRLGERNFMQLDSCKTKPNVFYPSASCSSSVLVSQSTSSENISTTPIKMSLSKNVDVNRKPGGVCENKDNPVSHISSTSNEKDPNVQLVAEVKGCCHSINSSDKIEKNDQISMDHSPAEKDEPSNCNLITHHDSPNHLYKLKGLQATQFELTDTFIVTPSAASGVCGSFESSSASYDQFNPAVDSPCWKGSLASHRSPFAVTERGTAKLISEISGGNVLNDQDLHRLWVRADEAFPVSSQNEYKDLDCNNNIRVENESSFLKTPSMMSGWNEVHISNGTSEPIEKYSLPRKQKHTPSQTLVSSHEEGNNASAGLTGSLGTIADSVVDIDTDSSPLLFYDKEHVSSSPVHQVGVPSRFGNPLSGPSDTSVNKSLPSIDPRLLVNALKNMSDLLCSICSNDMYALTEQDHTVFQQIIDNLGACVVKNVGSVGPMPELQCPESGSSHRLGKSAYPFKCAAACTSQVPSTEANDIQHRCGYQSCFEKQDMFQDFGHLRSDTFEEDDSMIQAIKKVLKKNFQDEDGELPQILFYKNLWLEAEAALCSLKYKARFARLTFEMGKHKPFKLPNSTLSESSLSAGATKEIPIPKIYTKDNTHSRIATSQMQDVEASVMDRFHVLKCRLDKPVPSHEGKLEAVDVVVSERMEEPTSPSSQNIQNGKMYKQPTSFDLDVVKRKKTCAHTGSGCRSEDRIVEARGNLQSHIGYSILKESALDLDVVSKRRDLVKEFQACFLDGSTIQSSIPKKHGSQVAAGEYDSPPSDWEHVLKEQFV